MTRLKRSKNRGIEGVLDLFEIAVIVLFVWGIWPHKALSVAAAPVEARTAVVIAQQQLQEEPAALMQVSALRDALSNIKTCYEIFGPDSDQPDPEGLIQCIAVGQRSFFAAARRDASHLKSNTAKGCSHFNGRSSRGFHVNC